MGQQQLLLLVLGIVIVGLAVVVGIQAFSENSKKANADALVNDAIRIVSDAQAWKLKPAAFGGGASKTGFTDVTFNHLGYQSGANPDYNGSNQAVDTPLGYENLNGIFLIAVSGGTLTLTAKSYEPSGSTVLNTIVVTVIGTTPADITTVVN